ncbi:hypothetical protein DAEQUDRAFT_724415 [Daedalea quercina L-15889]|uniref:ER transporter 6TM N-terminal domain-containing protein n=1 Tax=Daedalea quercina L-15889 TaxID=1314783 RepID=A0A165RR92_9APHY|nr:hypothetical protein DAEQUDRAFT_724415 [Daedalea quercina L-15889]
MSALMTSKRAVVGPWHAPVPSVSRYDLNGHHPSHHAPPFRFRPVMSQPTGDEKGAIPPQNPPKSSIWQNWALPPWISTNMRSSRSLKMLARCWVASWVGFIILLPHASLNTLGNTAFFALLASLMAPPNMPLQLFVFAVLTIIVGLCLGWALGAAGMAAALAARSQLLLRSELEKVEQSIAGLADPDALFQASIFEGDFLDTRSSVVFGVFLCFAVFVLSLMRAYAPRLTLMSIFGTIAADIYCSYGPLFPFAEYTILTSLLTSLACYMAIGLVVIIFVFPETLNHATLTSVTTLLDTIEGLVKLQEEVLSVGRQPNDGSYDDAAKGPTEQSMDEAFAEHGPLLTKMAGSRDAMLAMTKGFSGQLPMLNLEFSWGKWSGDDIKALEKPLAGVVGRVAAMQGFAKVVGRSPRARAPSTSASRASAYGDSTDSSDSSAHDSVMGDTQLFRELRGPKHHYAPDFVSLPDLFPILHSSTSPLRNAVADTLAAVRAVVHSINTRRYKRGSGAHLAECLAQLDASTARLTGALDGFRATDRLALLEPFAPFLNSNAEQDLPRPVPKPFRSLFVVYVFVANLVAVAQAVRTLSGVVSRTAHKRPRNRLWAPGAIALGKILGRRQKGDRGAVDDDVGGQGALGETPQGPQTEGWEREEQVYRRDPDGRPPSNPIQYVMNAIHHAWMWVQTPEALFAFKMVLVTIALWVPAVCRSSAHFVYAQKGLWALIMAQTTLNIYAADQIFNIFARVLGTFFGLVLGLLSWYIGSAKSNGSPYGMAAVVAVFLVPVLFLRLFSPMQYLPGVIMTSVTWALIIGYSWLDGHIAVLGNVGIGWPVAWRRFVLVTIGVAASSIVMIIPPQSARRSVRLRCAGTMASLSYLYSHLTAAWISSESFSDKSEDGDAANNVDPTRLPWVQEYRERFIEIAQQIQLLRAQAGIAKLEGNVRGKWPAEEYAKLVAVESEMAWALGVLGGSLSQLDDDTRMGLLKHTVVVNPNFIGDVMSAFILISQSLRTGEPIHQSQSQDLIERAFYHGNSPTTMPGMDAEALRDLRLKRLQSVTTYEYIFYASSVVAVFRLLEGLNEARQITANLCGEVPLEGFDKWREKYQQMV